MMLIRTNFRFYLITFTPRQLWYTFGNSSTHVVVHLSPPIHQFVYTLQLIITCRAIRSVIIFPFCKVLLFITSNIFIVICSKNNCFMALYIVMKILEMLKEIPKDGKGKNVTTIHNNIKN